MQKKEIIGKEEIKQYDINKTKRDILRKKIEEIREIKQNERIQNRENVVEDNKVGRFFELATINQINVNRINLQEIKNVFLEYFTGVFE